MKQSFALSAVAASVVATGLVAVAAPSATAAETPVTPPKVTAKPLTPMQRHALLRRTTIKRYGIFPLPVGPGVIRHFKLGKVAIRQIAAAKRFAASAKARSVRACESGGNYRINTGNGYYGAYQFDAGTWLANGGGRYAGRAHQAPAFAQDHIAYRTWLARGWQPWACA